MKSEYLSKIKPPVAGFEPWKAEKNLRQIAVLMSGGVDSSVTAAMLKQQGWQVLGITMKIPPALPSHLPAAGPMRLWFVTSSKYLIIISMSLKYFSTQRPGEQIAIEIETGKSDIKGNIEKSKKADIDKLIILAESPSSVIKCQKLVESVDKLNVPQIELMSWLDL